MNKKSAYIGCLGFIGVITTEFGVIGILPQLADFYHISIDKAGVLLSAFALVIALTGPLMTLLASGLDRRRVMLSAIFLFIITGIVSAFSPPFWVLIVVRILPAFLQPVYIASALSVAVAGGKKENENELMGIVFSGVSIAMVTTVPLATYLASLWSWEYSFMLQAVVSVIAWLAIYIGLPPMPVTEKRTYGSQLKILRQPVFLTSTAMNFFMISGWFSTYSYFADYLNRAKGMDKTTVSYMFFLFGIVGVIATWLSGKMLNRHVAKTTAIFLLGTLLIPLLLLNTGNSLPLASFIIALWGFLYSPSFLNASTYMISSAPESLEFANSLATSFGNLGVTVGTVVGGWIIANKGVAYTPIATLAFGLLAFSMMGLRRWLEKNKNPITIKECLS